MAITVEFGKCVSCSENNPKQLQACRKCSAPLPWAKMPKPKYSKAPTVKQPKVSKPVSQLDWGVFGVGIISFLMPIIGYFLYRSYAENGSENASVALIGSILDVVGHIVRVAVRSAA